MPEAELPELIGPLQADRASRATIRSALGSVHTQLGLAARATAVEAKTTAATLIMTYA